MVKYGRELRMEIYIKRRGKIEKVTEFAERIKKVQEKVGVALKKAQEEMKWQTNRGSREVEKWKAGDKVMLSMKDPVFKERLAKQLVDCYIGPYIIDEVVLTNVVKLWLPVSIRIHPVVNISQIVWYKKQVGVEEKRSKTNRGGQSGGMGSRKIIKQKESEESSKILGIVEEIHSRTQ